MRLSDLRNTSEVVEDRRRDPEFRAEWDRTAFAREVAVRVVAYRAERHLTQRDLARLTGLTQPAIGRLETGEHIPALSTLAKLSTATGLSFQLRVSDGQVGLAA